MKMLKVIKKDSTEFIMVDDFNVSTIRKLPFYPNDFYYLLFYEGEEKQVSDYKSEFYGHLVKAICNGKKITIKKAKECIHNDPKYNSILGHIKDQTNDAILDFCKKNQTNISPEQIACFTELYEITHYCFFKAPNEFLSLIVPETISIEEFDNTIDTNAEYYLRCVSENSKLVKEYYDRHLSLFSLFRNYLVMIFKSKDYLINYRSLFEVIPFNFYACGLQSEEEIIQFLNIFEYINPLNEEALKIMRELKKFYQDPDVTFGF